MLFLFHWVVNLLFFTHWVNFWFITNSMVFFLFYHRMSFLLFNWMMWFILFHNSFCFFLSFMMKWLFGVWFFVVNISFRNDFSLFFRSFFFFGFSFNFSFSSSIRFSFDLSCSLCFFSLSFWLLSRCFALFLFLCFMLLWLFVSEWLVFVIILSVWTSEVSWSRSNSCPFLN